ncbi:MAG: hydroxymethylglutaryl-CoA lyase [Lapillicoccus sp.]
MSRPDAVEVVEVSPRDGLQNESRHLDTATKLELVDRVVAAGARRVEVTGFARPDVVPALADADAVAAAVAGRPGVEWSALVLNARGYDRARSAGIRAVNMVVLATETFSGRNQRLSVAEAVAVAHTLRERATADGVRFTVTVGAAFGCPFEGEVPLERLRSVVDRVAAFAPDELALADTIGVGTPGDVTERFGLARELAPDLPLRAHFHDTRNTGIANAVAALDAGVSALDASLAGIGGCPFAPHATGNVATEDLVYCLHRMGVATGLDLDALLVDADWLPRRLGREPTSSLVRAGVFPPPPGSAEQ